MSVTLPNGQLRVLLVEDSEDDAFLLLRHLRKSGMEIELCRADTLASIQQLLSEQSWDIMLSDYSMPGFTGMDALALLKTTGMDIPFIMISGKSGEDTAVEAMKAGAHDYILKSNLSRLVPAIERELKEVENRAAHRKALAALRESEERFRLMADSSPLIIWMLDEHGQCNYVNRAWLDFTGRTLEEELDSGWQAIIHPDDLEQGRAAFKQALERHEKIYAEFRMRRADGEYRWMVDEGYPRRSDDGRFAGYIGSCVDVTEFKLAREEAEAANAKKSQFLATMSHELRTPLNAIIGYSEMLENGMAGDLNEKQQRYIRNVITSGRHLLDIINDILDLSKVEAGKVELLPEPIHLPSFFHTIQSLSQELAYQRNIMLTFDIPPELTTLNADPVRLKQIFFNLISNAIKFNREDGRVNVKLSLSNDRKWVICKVEDTGIGIPQDKLREVFDEFYQVDPSLSRKFEGTGLGLSLTRQLVQLHGGDIWVESKEGVGSTFTLTLPYRA